MDLKEPAPPGSVDKRNTDQEDSLDIQSCELHMSRSTENGGLGHKCTISGLQRLHKFNPKNV